MITAWASILPILVQILSIELYNRQIISDNDAQWIFFAGRFLQGLVVGIIIPASSRLVEEYTPTKYFSVYFTLFNAFNNLSKVLIILQARLMYSECIDP
jgi:MFS family permease